VIAGKEQLSGHDVFAHFTHVLPGKGRGFDLHLLLVHLLHRFDHDHGVRAFGKHMTGIDRKGVDAQAEHLGT
jgi:hypothetical protein